TFEIVQNFDKHSRVERDLHVFARKLTREGLLTFVRKVDILCADVDRVADNVKNHLAGALIGKNADPAQANDQIAAIQYHIKGVILRDNGPIWRIFPFDQAAVKPYPLT